MEHVKKWDTTTILTIEQSQLPYVVIVLNRPIQFAPAAFQRVWNQGTSFLVYSK